MGELKSALRCTLRIRRSIPSSGQVASKEKEEDTTEAVKEAAKWDQRRARVTAALIPGLKKLVDREFGPGASERIGRVEELYQRVGRGEIFEEDTPQGKRFA